MIALALILCASVSVWDGDSLRCGAERIRIHALDCAELREPGGPEAKRALIALLAGRTITIERRGRDRYGRTVAKLYADNADVAMKMIASGVCKEYCKYSRGEYGSCPNYR